MMYGYGYCATVSKLGIYLIPCDRSLTPQSVTLGCRAVTLPSHPHLHSPLLPGIVAVSYLTALLPVSAVGRHGENGLK